MFLVEQIKDIFLMVKYDIKFYLRLSTVCNLSESCFLHFKLTINIHDWVEHV